MIQKRKQQVMTALLFSLAVPLLGYISFGVIPAAIFLAGFFGGFLFWVLTPLQVPYGSIRNLYWITFALFILHRIEEKYTGFFKALSKLTGVAVPEILSVPVIVLVLASVGSWLAAPFLIKRESAFGYFLAWTLFASTGMSELAHFIFPLYANHQYGYFPGMWSVIILAPVSWYAMYRLSGIKYYYPQLNLA